MVIEAVILDIYNTVLRVRPPPESAEARWQELCTGTLRGLCPFSLAEFEEATQEIIDREHRIAREAGVQFPEIFWPAVVMEVVPDLGGLTAPELDRFLYRHAQLLRTVDLMPGAADALAQIAGDGLLAGIASNAQPYTLHELAHALAQAKLSAELFDPKLCFWSFEAGFGKPDPHVFRWLRAQLLARGVPAERTLVIGDRLDNDIVPARANGFQTWLFSGTPNREGSIIGSREDAIPSGDWTQLIQCLRAGFSV